MAEAQEKGYRGVTFLYHQITKQIMVRWIEHDIDQRMKDGTESLLMNIFKG